MGIPFRMVVEAEQAWEYGSAIGKDRVIVLDKRYQENYDYCDGFGTTKSPGSGPARNFIWDLSVSEGHSHHWIIDDNIKAFYRLNYNLKVPVSDDAIFRAMESFTLRYSNVAMSGPNYFMFASRKSRIRAFTPNTRIFSCNLIRNDVPFRWRCRYNEDLDLSLRILKGGWCTILFNAFLQEKTSTQYMTGGNTEAFYATEGTYPKSKMIVDLHPDVARLAQRWGRVHHYIDYSPFKNTKLIRKPGFDTLTGNNEYGMRLVQKADMELA